MQNKTKPNPVKRVRGRPVLFDRDSAIDVALSLFIERGYQGTSVNDLVQAIGISPPSLYAAFGSKEQLYREALERYVEGRGRFVSRALSKDISVERQVRQILHDAAVAFTPTGDGVPGCIVSGDLLMSAPADKEVARHLRDLREAPINAVAMRIEEAKVGGELPEGVDAGSLARYFSAVVCGMAVQARDGASRSELLAIAEIAMAAWP